MADQRGTYVLCLCTGNTCRSPMLEVLLRAELAAGGRDDVTVLSAGVAAAAGAPASHHAQTAMADRGLDLSRHRSRPLAAVDLPTIDQVWCMSASHAAVAMGAGVPPERLHIVASENGGVPDPYGGDLAEYRATAAVLSSAAAAIASSLPTQA